MDRSLADSPQLQFRPIQNAATGPATCLAEKAASLPRVDLGCETVIQAFVELPKAVRLAAPARVESRILKHRFLRQLMAQRPPPDLEVGWSARIQNREEALRPFVGKELHCVLIRLPGVQYTVEVDLESRTVVYWEWQSV